MAIPVAQVELIASWPTGERGPVSVRVHSPVQDTGSWTCQLELSGLAEPVASMGGEDAGILRHLRP
jgi:hypothetical protein